MQQINILVLLGTERKTLVKEEENIDLTVEHLF